MAEADTLSAIPHPPDFPGVANQGIQRHLIAECKDASQASLQNRRLLGQLRAGLHVRAGFVIT